MISKLCYFRWIVIDYSVNILPTGSLIANLEDLFFGGDTDSGIRGHFVDLFVDFFPLPFELISDAASETSGI